MAHSKALFHMFQSTLHLVVQKYGMRYWHNPAFTSSPEKAYLVRLAELLKEDAKIDLPEINPQLN